LRNQVNRLCGTANENDLLFAPGIDEALYLLARRFISCGCLFAQAMDTPMNIRILCAVVAIQCVDNDLCF